MNFNLEYDPDRFANLERIVQKMDKKIKILEEKIQKLEDIKYVRDKTKKEKSFY